MKSSWSIILRGGRGASSGVNQENLIQTNIPIRMTPIRMKIQLE
jgi:hypothetical protein